MTDPYTMQARLCDDSGVVSDERVPPGNPGTTLDPELTYRKLNNNLRAHIDQPPYTGEPFACTGSAHLAGQHIRCTSPAHTRPTAPKPENELTMATGRDIIRVLNDRKGFDWWWDDLDADIRADIIAELDGLPGIEASPPATEGDDDYDDGEEDEEDE